MEHLEDTFFPIKKNKANILLNIYFLVNFFVTGIKGFEGL